MDAKTWLWSGRASSPEQRLLGSRLHDTGQGRSYSARRDKDVQFRAASSADCGQVSVPLAVGGGAGQVVRDPDRAGLRGSGPMTGMADCVRHLLDFDRNL